LNDNKIEAVLYHGGSGWQTISADISNTEGWFHVAYHWTIDDGIGGGENFRMDLYIDGHLKATQRLSSTNGVGDDRHYWFGRPAPGRGDDFYTGYIDDLQVYSGERRYYDCAGSHLDTATDTPGLFHLDRNVGTTAVNKGSGSDGTITDASWTTGRYDSGLHFDGDGDNVSAGVMDLGNKGTIEKHAEV
jgi:hypothetical protein